MLGGGARWRSGVVDAATAPLLDDDSRLGKCFRDLALHVLVVADFDGLYGQEPCDTAGENVTVTIQGAGSDEAARLADSFRFDACLKRERLIDILRSAATA
jgi:hypothetical protein